MSKTMPWLKVGLFAFAILFLYVGVSTCVYAFRHPELTSTQRTLRTWEALTWQ